MELSTGPEIRYGVELSDGITIIGSRKHVLDSAVKACKERGVSVVAWTVPGATKVLKEQRMASLEEEYNKSIVGPNAVGNS